LHSLTLREKSGMLQRPCSISDRPLRACLGNGGFKWMEEDWRGFWEILNYNGNSSTSIPFIPLHSTNSQTSPKPVQDWIRYCRAHPEVRPPRQVRQDPFCLSRSISTAGQLAASLLSLWCQVRITVMDSSCIQSVECLCPGISPLD
jgi:hypothetical protein